MNMINQFQLFSEYNKLMNQRLYETVEKLSDEIIRENKGAFFKSILGTLNHIMVGDIVWLKRFSAHPSSRYALSYFSSLEKPESLNSILFSEFGQLREEREKIDEIIIQWINSLSESDFDNSISYENMKGIKCNKLFSSLISHLFLHQVHHRGQVTTLLSQSSV